MKPVFSFNEIRTTEKQIIEKENFPSIVLMENAGKNSFDVLVNEVQSPGEYNIFIICGKGNNAGDGYTLARHLSINNFEYRIVQLEESSSLKGDTLVNYDALSKCIGLNEISVSFEDFEKNIKKYQKKTKILIIDA